MDVRLHLAHGDPERARDLLITLLLEVEQHERHALVVRQLMERPLEPGVLLGQLEISSRRRVGRDRRLEARRSRRGRPSR